MLDILIVEDDGTKAATVTAELRAIKGVDAERIVVAVDERTARKHLTSKRFHLLILDIHIPVLFGDPPRMTGGVTFLNALHADRRVHLPIHVIGLTAYDAAIAEGAAAFEQNVWGLLKFSVESEVWRKQLRSKVEYLVAALAATNLEPTYAHDVAVVCALRDLELGAVLRLPYDWQELPLPDDPTTYEVGVCRSEERSISVVAASCSHMGMPAAAALATKMICRFRPRFIVMTGVTAGVAGEVNIGDVLVAESSWDYGSGKYQVEAGRRAFYPDPRPVSLEGALIEKFQTLAMKRDFLDSVSNAWVGEKPPHPLNIRVGPLPSGAAVVADPSILADLKTRSRKIIGLDMESFGIYYAAHHCSEPRPTPLVIKAVSDFADSDKAQTEPLRSYSAFASAAVFDYAMKNILTSCR